MTWQARRSPAPLLLALLIAACGETPDPDAGLLPDVPPPPRCLELAGPLGPLEDPAHLNPLTREAVEACGGCIEDHAVSINPSPYGTADAWQVPLPDGVVVVMPLGVTVATFITTDGEVIPLPELPYPDPTDSEVGSGTLIPIGVPDSDRVWILSYRPATNDTVGVLYRVNRGGWERLAVSVAELHQPLAALDNGELLAQRFWKDGRELVLLIPRDDGSGSAEEVVLSLSESVDTATSVTFGWPLATGEGAIHFRGRTPSAPNGGSYIGIVSPTLRTVRVQPAFSDDPPPPNTQYAKTLQSSSYVIHLRSRHVLWMVRGLIEDGSHLWIQGIDPEGNFMAEPPGLLLNDTPMFTLSELRPGGGTPTDPHFVTVSSQGVFAQWDDSWVADGPWTTWLRRVEVSPTLSLSEEVLEYPPPDGAFPPVSAFPIGPYHDGRGNAFGYNVAESGPARDPTQPSTAVSGIGDEPGFEWTRFFEDCPRSNARGGSFGPAGDDGLWVVWVDEFVEPDGAISWVTKAALIHSDGTFGW